MTAAEGLKCWKCVYVDRAPNLTLGKEYQENSTPSGETITGEEWWGTVTVIDDSGWAVRYGTYRFEKIHLPIKAVIEVIY